MAILKIAKMGNPALRDVAEPIADPSDPEVLKLLEDMVETMEDAQGTGLAATQVHRAVSAVVYYVEEGRGGKDQEAVPLTKLINPVITPLEGAPIYDWEGCLSVPGLIGLVPRPPRIHMSAVTPDGAVIDREYEGFHARVLQHECDHLAGILYPQRMDDLSLLLFREELRHGVPEKAKALLKTAPEDPVEEEET